MAIPQKIINLTKLALSDRILTYTERQTIVDAAIKEGVSETEINQYLDDALHKRLQSFTKEELRSCPHCGAQIPLISDKCMFCGVTLENDGDFKRIDISGDEADIIRSENLKTSRERTEIKTCPDCGAPLPLISHICSNCGHVFHEQRDNELNIKNLIENINNSISNLKNQPKLKFSQVLSDFVSPISLLALLVFWLFWILAQWDYTPIFILVLIFSLILVPVPIKMYTESNSQVVKDVKNLSTALANYELFMRQTTILYGNNSEAIKLLQEYQTEIQHFKAERSKRRRHLCTRLAVVLTILTAIVLGIAALIGKDRYMPEALLDTKITLRSDTTDNHLYGYTTPNNAVLTFCRSYDKRRITIRVNKVKMILTSPENKYMLKDLNMVLLDDNGQEIQTLGIRDDWETSEYDYAFHNEKKLSISSNGERYFYLDFNIFMEYNMQDIKYIVNNAKSYRLYSPN
ncbi:MAG: zinc ribbon domain-containing protein [Bacteroidales bacterium]|nr:zinc ribbon domain-containing protein [Bacteroidales bacterium]